MFGVCPRCFVFHGRFACPKDSPPEIETKNEEERPPVSVANVPATPCKRCGGLVHTEENCPRKNPMLFVEPVVCEFCNRSQCSGRHACYESIQHANAKYKAEWKAARAAKQAAKGRAENSQPKQ